MDKVKYSEPVGEAIETRTLHGLEELSLRRSFNDSSSENDSGNGMLAREFVTTWAAAKTEDVARTTLRGPPVYRTAYTLVEFQFCTDDADNVCNSRFSRAYLIAEPIDKGFFKMRYDDEKPTVFSMAHGCALKIEKASEGFTYPCLEPEYLDGKKINKDEYPEAAKGLRSYYRNRRPQDPDRCRGYGAGTGQGSRSRLTYELCGICHDCWSLG